MVCLFAQYQFEVSEKSNVYRGAYPSSMHATDMYDDARRTVARFIGAEPQEIIFVRNTTEALNLAAAICHKLLGSPMYAMTTLAEHHSNFLPWRWDGISEAATTQYVPCGKDGTITPDAVRKAIRSAVRTPDVFAFHHVSNVTGAVTDVRKLTRIARDNNMISVCDASQSIPHMKIDVKKLDVDMLAFSGHKMCAPMGIGVLYVCKGLANSCDPVLTGGGMIAKWDTGAGAATWEPVPYRFEAGTPNVSGAIALAEACTLYDDIGYDVIHSHESALVRRLMNGLKEISGVHIVGPEDPDAHCGVVSFTVDGVNANTVGGMLGEKNVCVRAGYHCAAPLHDAILGGEPSCRASVLFYNTEDEIDTFLASLREIISEEKE